MSQASLDWSNDEWSTLGMVHTGDPVTSKASAEVILQYRTELHEKVMAAFGARGPMTDEELEQLPEFAGYGPSTILKRRSELFHAGRLAVADTRTNSRGRKMVVWARVEVA